MTNKKLIAGVIGIAIIAFLGIFFLVSSQQNSNDELAYSVGGKYLSFPNGSLSKMYLINSTARYGTYEENMAEHHEITVKKGDPCVIINATVRNDYDKDYFMIVLAQLYNASGEEVGRVTGLAPWEEFVQGYVRSNETHTFDIYVKYDKKDVASYNISLDYKLLDEPLP